MDKKELARLWTQAQQRAELYKTTRDPRVREEAAALLWRSLVAQGGIIARRKLPVGRLQQIEEVAQDAAASLLTQQFTVVLEEHDPDEGRSLRNWMAEKLKWKIQKYAETGRWYDEPGRQSGAGDGDEEEGSVEDLYGPDLAPIYEQSPGFDIGRAYANREFWRIAQRELTDDELETLALHMSSSSNAEAAEAQGVPYDTFMSRMSRARLKLAKVYKDIPVDRAPTSTATEKTNA